MYEHIKICIFLFLYFQNVLSFKIYQLDSAEEYKLLPKIRQLLNQGDDEPDYQNIHVGHAKRVRSELKPMEKSVLVKRVIPHGYTTGEYEYDPKLNTLFKPLARYHVKKPIENREISLLKEMEPKKKQKEDKDRDLIVLVQDEMDQIDLLKQIQKFISKSERQQNRKKKKYKGRFRGLFDKQSLLLLRQKSGEENDPYAPGKIPNELEPPNSSTETEEKIIFPTYPFWNYWTHQDSITQDRCPGDLVKVGNMCISSIGHRRSGHSSRNNKSNHPKRHSIRASRKRHLYGKKK